MRLAELLLVLMLGTTTASQMEMTSQVTVPTGVEAWYHVSPLAQEGLPPVNPYEDDTLHVAVGGGAERARTYLTLRLDTLPTGARITSGTLTLPVDPDWSVVPELARIRVCAAIGSFQSVQGSLDPPPEVDCSRTVEALYHEEPSPHFTADLRPFDLRTEGLALLPVDDPDTWHAAFYAKEHPAGRPITASLVIRWPSGEPMDDPLIVPRLPDLEGLGDPAPVPFVGPVPAPPPVDEPPDPPRVDDTETAVADRFFDDPLAAYVSWVLLVPLALLAFVGYYGRVLVVYGDEDR